MYHDYEVPDDWNVKLYSYDMGEIVNCVCCGKPIKYGDRYTSRRYHDEHGFGYTECYDCYYESMEV